MNEIVSRWSKKSLSQIFTLLTGIVLSVSLINKYTIININIDFFEFISIDSIDPTKQELFVLTVMLLGSFLFELICALGRFISKKFPNISFYNEDEKVEKYTVVLTISSILDLISSVSGLLFVFILKSNDINHILKIIIYFAIVAKIVCAIYTHFYYQNLSVVSKVLRVKK